MSWVPALEVREKDNHIQVCAELPGLKPEEVKVEVNEDSLVIQGERKQEQQQDPQNGRWHSERRHGRFYRSIALPEGANAEQARAEFRNGELHITVPVERPQNRRREIPIGGAASSQSSQPAKK